MAGRPSGHHSTVGDVAGGPQIPGWVASGVRATPDGSATYKLFAALFTFPIFWLLDGLLVGAFFGSGWGIAATVLTPFAGLAALCLLDRNKPR